MIRLFLQIGYPDGRVNIVKSIRDGGSLAAANYFPSAHRAAVTCFESFYTLSNGESLILSGSDDGAVKLWDVRTKFCTYTFECGSPVAFIASDMRNGVLCVVTRSNQFLVWKTDFLKHSDPTPAPSQSLEPLQRSLSTRNDYFKILLHCSRDVAYVVDADCILVLRLTDLHILARLHGHAVPISLIVWSREFNLHNLLAGEQSGVSEEQRTTIVSADAQGNLLVWDDSKVSNSSSKICKLISPLRVISNSHAGPVTCISLDPFKITSGGVDGFVRVWDILTGNCLRALNIRFSRHLDTRSHATTATNSQHQHTITSLHTTYHQIIIATGAQVKSWDFDPECHLSMLSLPRRSKQARLNRKKRNSFPIPQSPKAMMQVEMRRDLVETNKILQREYLRRLASCNFKPTATHNIQGLSEQEMLDYALFLSMNQLDPLSPPLPPQHHHSPHPTPSRIPFSPVFQGQTPILSPSLSFHPFLLDKSMQNLQLPPAFDNSLSFPPLGEVSSSNSLSTSINSNSSAQPIQISSTPRKSIERKHLYSSASDSHPSTHSSRPVKMSLSQFHVEVDSRADSSTPRKNSFTAFSGPGSTSAASSPSSFNHASHSSYQPSSHLDTFDDSDDDLDYIDPPSIYSPSRPNPSLFQVIPSPQALMARKEEEELQYVLEMSLLDQ